jgi:hypothetical protein
MSSTFISPIAISLLAYITNLMVGSLGLHATERKIHAWLIDQSVWYVAKSRKWFAAGLLHSGIALKDAGERKHS